MLNLEKNRHYLLACSFGPDSMALFDMLLKEGYKFSVAHVNYHLRKESNEEESKLRDFCVEHNIGIYVRDVNEVLGESNLEMKCREIRYNFFINVMKENKFDALLVAHQEDDLIETYLMQKRRKNLVNYFGIKEISYFSDIEIIRPLLRYRKEELMMYCRMFNVPYAIDKTNLEDHFLRNQIRHSVVEKYEKLSQIFITISKINDNKIDSYLRLNDVEFLYAIVALGRKLKPDFIVSKKQGEELRKVLESDKPNIALNVDGLCFFKEYDVLGFRGFDENLDYFYDMAEPGILDTPYFFLDFTVDSSNRNVKEDDYPLVIRNAQKDDEYEISGYKKELRRLFIDWKMPESARNRWPIIVNKDGIIVYVPRYQKDFVPEENCNFFVKL